MSNDFRRGIKIYLDNSEYTKGIKELEANLEKLEKQEKSLGEEQARMKQAGLDTSEAYKKNEKTLGNLTKQITKSKNSVGNYKEGIKQVERVMNNLSGTSMKELTQVQRHLRTELRTLDRTTDHYRLTLQHYNSVTKEVSVAQREMNSRLGATNTGMSKFANGFNKYIGVGTAFIASVTGVSYTFRRLAENVAEMDDVYADVMKTTGNTREEVLALNEEFKRMNTRTSREELNRLAYEAGKLNLKSKEDILAFVEAADQINVALGEDLGEDAIKTIGKMVGVFSKSSEHLQSLNLKEQMLSVGSAINELGASSSANEGYLVQFAGRLGGVASQAGISIDQVLGFGSALDQNMQNVEMSATAIQQFIMQVMSKPAEFARISGMEIKKFNELLRTDTNEALKIVLRSMGEKGGFQQLIPIFEKVGLNGARAVNVLSSLASNMDKVDEAQRVANQSLREGTSLTKEFSVKNNTLAAKLDKAKKEFKDISLELGSKLNPILLKSTSAMTSLIKLLVKHPGLLKTIAIATGILIARYTVLYAIKTKDLAITKAQVIWEKTAQIATLAYAAAKGVLTGRLTMARRAMILLNKTMIVNPYLAVAAAITAIGIAVYKFSTKTTKAQKAVKEMTEELNKEKVKLNNLFEAYKKANEGTEEKINLLKEIKRKYGDYLIDLIDEKGYITDIAKAQERANTALQNKYVLAKKQSVIDEADEEYFEKQTELVAKLKKELDEYLTDFQSENVYSKINQMFQNSGIDVNLTARKATNLIKKNGATITSEMRSIISKMSHISNARNVAHREAEEAFDPMLKKPKTNMLETVVVKGKRRNKSNDNKPPTNPNDKSDPYEVALKALERDFKKQQIIEKKKKQSAEKLKEQLLANELGFLKDKKALQKTHKKDMLDTEMEIVNKQIQVNKNADKTLLLAKKQTFLSQLKLSSEAEKHQLEVLENQKQSGLISESEYEKSRLAILKGYAENRLDATRKYEEDIKDTVFATEDAKTKAVEEAVKKREKAEKEVVKIDKQIQKQKLEEEEEFRKKKQAIRKKYGLDEIRKSYKEELAELRKHLTEINATKEEFEKAETELKLRYATQRAKEINAITNSLADAVTAYHQMEADSLEAEKQRELQAVGDNAEAREQINQKYAQKELDLKKKQANADAGIKIAQAFSDSALAIMNILSVHAANPILAGILSAGVAVTTGFQIASIVKQRNAIMSMTLDSPSGGGSMGSNILSSKRVAKSQVNKETTNSVPQAKDGRWNVVGEDDGQVYQNVGYVGRASTGIISRPTLIAERGDELIVDNPTLRNIRMNAPHILSQIQEMRVSQRAKGNYKNIENPISHTIIEKRDNTDLKEVLLSVKSLLEYLKENKIEAGILLSEFEKKRNLYNESVKRGSR